MNARLVTGGWRKHRPPTTRKKIAAGAAALLDAILALENTGNRFWRVGGGRPPEPTIRMADIRRISAGYNYNQLLLSFIIQKNTDYLILSSYTSLTSRRSIIRIAVSRGGTGQGENARSD